MNAKEMTNEELAKELLETVGLDGPFCICDRCETVREAAARLKNHIVLPDAVKIGNQMKDLVDQNADLRSRLKVAEDALDKIFKLVFVDCEVAMVAKNALAAIREEK